MTATTVARRKFPVTVTNGALTKDEAQALTTCIKQELICVWQLVTEAHDRKAWQALGYPSWKAYVETELRMSESRSYQLIDAGHVVRVAQQVIGNNLVTSNVLEALSPTAREASRAKAQLPALRRTLKAQVKLGLPPHEALREAIKALPDPPKRVINVPVQRTKAKATTRRIPKGMTLCKRCAGLGYV